MSLLTAATLLLAAVNLPLMANAGAWHMDMLSTLVVERLDPVVNPNQVSSHMHRVYGGSAFAASYNYDSQFASKCTTTSLTIDKSNYWSPQLYWINNDTTGADGQHTFTPIPATSRFYYFLDNTAPTTKLTAFPKGFRMLAGDPNNKSPQPWIDYFGCIGGNQQIQGFNFPNACSGGVQSKLHFPSCWDGVNLYKDDQSHVAYATSVTGGLCPYSHPVKLPAIMLEVNWQTPSILNNAAQEVVAGNLAWANGDTTGFGVHADFINGWDVDILQAALDNPNCNNNTMSIQDCETFSPYFQSIQAEQGCTIERGPMQEQFGNADGVAVPMLPGCNPIWGASGAKPTCDGANAKLATSTPSVSSFQGNQDGTTYAAEPPNYIGNTNGSWVDMGCISGQGSFSGGQQYYDLNTMTVESCQNYCAGSNFKYAALSVNYCYCGNTFDSSQTFRTGCNTPCPGNKTETCGIAYSAEVYYNSAPTPKANAGDYVGCYTDTGAHNLQNFNFTNAAMTPQLCQAGCAEVSPSSTYAGLENSDTCACGTQDQLNKGSLVPDSLCTSKCKGNSSLSCGATYDYSVYSVTTAVKTATTAGLPSASDPTWIGCYDAGYQNQALTAYTFNGNTVSVDQCRTLCTQAGYSLMSLVNGNSCKCDNSIKTTIKRQPAFQCSNACAGNAKQTCGGNQLTAIYNLTSTTGSSGSGSSASSAYLGCYQDSSSPRTLPNGYYTNAAMTNEQCIQNCALQGYAYSGTEGNQCWCSSTLNRNLVTDPSTCSNKCPGNSTQSCGGYYRLSVSSTAGAQVPTYPSGYKGCFSESYGTNLLKANRYASVANDAAFCVARCKSLGYSLAGTMGTMCACDNAFQGNGGTRSGDITCSTACPGASSEQCGLSGSSSYYSVYNTNGTSLYGGGSAGTSSSATASSSKPATVSASSSKPATASASSSKPATASASGVTGSSSKLVATTASSSKPASASTSGAATSKTSSVATSKTSSVATSKTSSVATSSKTSSSAAPTSTAVTVNGYVYSGCIQDGSSRAMSSSFVGSNTMTVEACQKMCANYKLFGMENGNQCFCANTLAYNTTLPETRCNAKCTGNSTQLCGGGYTISLWQKASVGQNLAVTSASSTAAKTSTAASSSSASSSAATPACSVPSTNSWVAAQPMMNMVIPAAETVTVTVAAPAASTAVADAYTDQVTRRRANIVRQYGRRQRPTFGAQDA